jgi:hypothetical protein
MTRFMRPRPYVVEIPRAHTEQYARNLTCVPPAPAPTPMPFWWQLSAGMAVVFAVGAFGIGLIRWWL